MDERVRGGAGWWDRSEPVEALAALAVGVVVAVRGLPLFVQAGYTDLVEGVPVRAAAVACALLAVAVALVALVPRLPGWPLAAGAAALVLVADLVLGGEPAGLAGTGSWPVRGAASALLTAAGVGLALGGVLLAVGQAPRSARWLPAAGLAAGLVLHPVSTTLVLDVLPTRHVGSVGTVTVQLWLALLACGLAALLAYRRGLDEPPPPAGRPAVVPVVVVAAAAGSTLLGLLVRSWVVRVFRVGPNGLTGYRRTAVVEAFAHWSLVAVAAAVGVLLLWYAYRAGGVAAARWVVLCVGAGPATLYGAWLAYRTSPSQVFLVVVTGVAALTAAALLALLAARALPWDAFGLVLVAVAMPLAAPVIRAELPSAELIQPVLTVFGLGLVLGFGLSAAALGVSRRVEDTGLLTGLLVLGPAAFVLSTLAMAPVVVRSQSDAPYREPLFTVPVFVAVTAVVLGLLFAFTRAVERLRRDLRAEAAVPAADPAD